MTDLKSKLDSRSELRKSKPRFLIVSRTGTRSLHRHWIGGAGRGFDAFLSCFDPRAAPEAQPGVTVEFRPGSKVQGYAGILRDHAALVNEYDYICFMDEDLQVTAEVMLACFRRVAEYDLKIAQPALAWGSHFSYAGLLQQPQFILRYVNFVEMMCPIFRKDILQEISPLYSMGFESGIDLIWCNSVVEGPRDFGVIDSCPILHTQPVGSRASENGFRDVHAYEDHVVEVLRRYDLPRHRLATYEAVTNNGRRIRGRLNLVLASASLLGALCHQPKKRTLLKCCADMVIDQLFRGPRNTPLRGLENGAVRPKAVKPSSN
ncbi:hypothetical protein [Pseudoroseicyclus sp. CXY001]|uniref:hypothetical protein n=1 Tax=Pseudoroseicyclus sp. CXY001 TaxID=3242492 RepID=UPI003570AB16